MDYMIEALSSNDEIGQDNIENDDSWDQIKLYVKRWAKYDADGKFLGRKVCLIQDLLPIEEVDYKISCVVTEPTANGMDDDESKSMPIFEVKAFVIKVAEENEIKPMNIDSWVDAVESNFMDIGIDTVSEL
jgi:hypothetical protein